MKEINKLKEGDFFKLKESSKTVYVRKGYCRSSRRYVGGQWEDISEARYLPKGKLVFIDFDF